MRSSFFYPISFFLAFHDRYVGHRCCHHRCFRALREIHCSKASHQKIHLQEPHVSLDLPNSKQVGSLSLTSILCPSLLSHSFLLAMTIDVFYFLSGFIRSLYFTSYVYVITDWSTDNFAYFNNISTVALSVFGLFAGLWLRYTHRYKLLQLTGLNMRLLGMGLSLRQEGQCHRRCSRLHSTSHLHWRSLLRRRFKSRLSGFSSSR